MYAWSKDQSRATGLDVLGYLNDWGKRERYPRRFADWSREEVDMAVAEGFLAASAAET